MTQIPSIPPPALYRKGNRDYRRWTKAHKRLIVEESFLPGLSVSVVARRHDVNTNQVFKWRQAYFRGELGKPTIAPSPDFIPVGVIGQDGRLIASSGSPLPASTVPPVSQAPASQPVPQLTNSPSGIIEVVLQHGIRVRCKGNVDLPTLQHVIKTAASLP
jgi:transposase